MNAKYLFFVLCLFSLAFSVTLSEPLDSQNTNFWSYSVGNEAAVNYSYVSNMLYINGSANSDSSTYVSLTTTQALGFTRAIRGFSGLQILLLLFC